MGVIVKVFGKIILIALLIGMLVTLPIEIYNNLEPLNLSLELFMFLLVFFGILSTFGITFLILALIYWKW